MNREHKWYPGLDELFDYPGIHPTLMQYGKKHNAVGTLRTLYNDLSASVHGRRVDDLEMRTALEKIAYSDQSFEKQVENAQKVRCCGKFYPCGISLRAVCEFYRHRAAATAENDTSEGKADAARYRIATKPRPTAPSHPSETAGDNSPARC